jgi:hypothetical protein
MVATNELDYHDLRNLFEIFVFQECFHTFNDLPQTTVHTVRTWTPAQQHVTHKCNMQPIAQKELQKANDGTNPCI